jgi:hypothetical protein
MKVELLLNQLMEVRFFLDLGDEDSVPEEPLQTEEVEMNNHLQEVQFITMWAIIMFPNKNMFKIKYENIFQEQQKDKKLIIIKISNNSF